MDKQKQTFIESLLRNKRLKPGQRERVLSLAAQELGRADDKDLTQRVERIEEVVFAEEENLTKSLIISTELGDTAKSKSIKPEFLGKSDSDKKLPKYSDPSVLYRFLFAFNQNEILKSACHDINLSMLKSIREYCGTGDNYNYLLHQKKVVDEFESLVARMKPSFKVAALIRGYLTGIWKGNPEYSKNGWSSDAIDYHWLHKDLLKWIEGNKEWPPHLSEGITMEYGVVGPEIKRFTSNITGETITYFRDLVLHFKNMFHLRYGNSLNSIIKHTNSTVRWEGPVEFEVYDEKFPENIELFTDVDKVKQAYKKIINLIIDRQKKADPNKKPVVEIALKRTSNSIILSILHKDSIYQKSIQDTIDRGVGASYTDLIKFQVNGLCNLYLNADFGREGYARINLWNGESRQRTTCPPIYGVEHELEFLK